jgi:hypothetical protein
VQVTLLVVSMKLQVDFPQRDFMLRLVTQELSLLQQMQPLGLQGLLGHQIIYMESPLETVHML